MAEKPTTQKSQPYKGKERGVEPIDIPIPTRGQVFGDLAKAAKPQKPLPRKRRAKK
jgi:hypothetical protein